MLEPGQVLITDEKGIIQDIVSTADAGENVQHFEGIITPGFINAHCHLELSHMKGLIPEHTGLVDFVFKIVNERHFPDEEIAAAIAKAEEEMIANGIVAVGDICNNLSTLSQKTKGNLNYYNFIEVSGWMPAVAEMRFLRGESFLEEFRKIQYETGNTQSVLSPHAPYSVSTELWNRIIPFFEDHTITIHNQETAFEDDLFLTASGDFSRMYEMMKMDISFFKPTGKSSLQSYYPNLATAKEIILVHNTFTKEADVVFAQHAKKVNWCICINANQYIENALPPVDLLRKNNARIVVGTDSLASNHSLDMLAELKTITKHFPGIPLTELLQWVTSNGAKALQMDDTLGSFEKGKKPGVLLLSGIENGITDLTSVKRLV